MSVTAPNAIRTLVLPIIITWNASIASPFLNSCFQEIGPQRYAFPSNSTNPFPLLKLKIPALNKRYKNTLFPTLIPLCVNTKSKAAFAACVFVSTKTPEFLLGLSLEVRLGSVGALVAVWFLCISVSPNYSSFPQTLHYSCNSDEDLFSSPFMRLAAHRMMKCINRT